MYQASCSYCEDWKCNSIEREEGIDRLADHLLHEHKETLGSLPKQGGKSSTGIVRKGSKCKSGKAHRIKEDLTSDLKCPVCSYPYSNYITRWVAAWMIEEKEE